MGDDTTPRRSGQLRDAIDRGKGGDKIAHPDPATVPLGTDEEAGGNVSSPAAVATAYRQEVGGTPDHAPRGAGSRGLLFALWGAFALVVGGFMAFFAWQLF